MKTKILLIDDEVHCTEFLKNLIERNYVDKYEIVSTNNSKDGLKLLLNNLYDIVFIDVEMPFLNGFDVLETLNEISFHLIFTTAYDKYALKAIKFSALDYLLKPIQEDELKEALNKADLGELKQNKNQLNQLMLNVKNNTFNKIGIPSLDGIEFVLINDIIRCESDSNYTKIVLTANKVIVSSKTLKEYEVLLKDNGFIRVHNSDLINMHHMKKYVKGDGGNVIMSDGSTITVSRRRKEDFLNSIE